MAQVGAIQRRGRIERDVAVDPKQSLEHVKDREQRLAMRQEKRGSDVRAKRAKLQSQAG